MAAIEGEWWKSYPHRCQGCGAEVEPMAPRCGGQDCARWPAVRGRLPGEPAVAAQEGRDGSE